MTTVSEIVSAAVRQLGISNLQGTKLSQCREALNIMLKDWALLPSGIGRTTRENFTLTSGTAEYTMGSGKDFDTTQPLRIVKSFVRSNAIDYPVGIFSVDGYGGVSQKATADRPHSLYRERYYGYDNLVLFPVPNAAYDLHIWSHKPLGTYTSLDDDLELPPEYEPAIKYNLALVVAPELAVKPYPSTVAMASRAFKGLRNMNRPPIPRLNTNIFSGSRTGALFDVVDPDLQVGFPYIFPITL